MRGGLKKASDEQGGGDMAQRAATRCVIAKNAAEDAAPVADDKCEL